MQLVACARTFHVLLVGTHVQHKRQYQSTPQRLLKHKFFSPIHQYLSNLPSLLHDPYTLCRRFNRGAGTRSKVIRSQLVSISATRIAGFSSQRISSSLLTPLFGHIKIYLSVIFCGTPGRTPRRHRNHVRTVALKPGL